MKNKTLSEVEQLEKLDKILLELKSRNNHLSGQEIDNIASKTIKNKLYHYIGTKYYKMDSTVAGTPTTIKKYIKNLVKKIRTHIKSINFTTPYGLKLTNIFINHGLKQLHNNLSKTTNRKYFQVTVLNYLQGNVLTVHGHDFSIPDAPKFDNIKDVYILSQAPSPNTAKNDVPPVCHMQIYKPITSDNLKGIITCQRNVILNSLQKNLVSLTSFPDKKVDYNIVKFYVKNHLHNLNQFNNFPVTPCILSREWYNGYINRRDIVTKNIRIAVKFYRKVYKYLTKHSFSLINIKQIIPKTVGGRITYNSNQYLFGRYRILTSRDMKNIMKSLKASRTHWFK